MADKPPERKLRSVKVAQTNYFYSSDSETTTDSNAEAVDSEEDDEDNDLTPPAKRRQSHTTGKTTPPKSAVKKPYVKSRLPKFATHQKSGKPRARADEQVHESSPLPGCPSVPNPMEPMEMIPQNERLRVFIADIRARVTKRNRPLTSGRVGEENTETREDLTFRELNEQSKELPRCLQDPVRQWTKKVERWSDGPWQYPIWVILAIPPPRSRDEARVVGVHPWHWATTTQIEATANDILIFFNQWRGALPDVSAGAELFRKRGIISNRKPIGRLFLEDALARHGAEVTLYSPSVVLSDSRPVIACAFSIANPAAEKTEYANGLNISTSTMEAITPGMVDTLHQQLPQNARYYVPGEVKKGVVSPFDHVPYEEDVNGVRIHGSGLPEDMGEYEHMRPIFERGILLGRVMCHKFTRRGISLKFAKSIWYNLLDAIVDPEARVFQALDLPLYGGTQLFYIKKHQESSAVQLEPSKNVQRALGFFSVRIRSKNMARASAVIAAANNKFLETGDLKEMVITAFQAAQHVNKQISAHEPCDNWEPCPRTDPLGCTDHFVVCAKCGLEKLCCTFKRGMSGSLVCRICLYAELSDPNPALSFALKSLGKSQRHEMHKAGLKLDDPRVVAYRELAKAKVKSLIPDNAATFPNAYRGSRPELLKDEYPGMVFQTRQSYSPSIDAAQCLAWSDELNGIAPHTASNIVITTPAFNRAKNFHLPALLAILGEFSRERHKVVLDLRKPDLTESKRAALQSKLWDLSLGLIQETTKLLALRLKFMFILTDAKRKPMTKAHCLWHRQELIAGKQRPGSSGPWDRRRLLVVGKFSHFKWTAKEKEILSLWTEQVEKEFCVTLKRVNGCPHVGHPRDDPLGWNWEMVGKLFSERLDRMAQGCNNRWETVETKSTLFAFAILVTCCNRCTEFKDCVWTKAEKEALHRRFSDLLGLSLALVLDVYHPLAISFSHRVHGRAMATGIPVDFKDITDFDIKKSNTLMEARITNGVSLLEALTSDPASKLIWSLHQIKSNSPSSDYSKYQTDMRDIEVSPNEYDPRLEMTSPPPGMDVSIQADEQEALDFTEHEIADEDEIPLDLEDESDDSDPPDIFEVTSPGRVSGTILDLPEAQSPPPLLEPTRTFSTLPMRLSNSPSKASDRVVSYFLGPDQFRKRGRPSHVVANADDHSPTRKRLLSTKAKDDVTVTKKPTYTGHQVWYNGSFPHGSTLLPTSSLGLQCVYHAIILSNQHQNPTAPQIQLSELQAMGESDTLAGQRIMMEDARDVSEVGGHVFNILADFAAAVLHQCGLFHDVIFVLGIKRAKKEPFIIDVPGSGLNGTPELDEAGNRRPLYFVWIHNDESSITDPNVLNHYSGMKPNQAPIPTVQDPSSGSAGIADGNERQTPEQQHTPVVIDLTSPTTEPASTDVSSHSKASEPASTQPKARESAAEASPDPYYASWMGLQLSAAVSMASRFRTDSDVRSCLRNMLDSQLDEDAVMFVSYYVQLQKRLRVLQG